MKEKLCYRLSGFTVAAAARECDHKIDKLFASQKGSFNIHFLLDIGKKAEYKLSIISSARE